ncbi:rfaE bifunctional protein [Desulfatibacillum aliphaticivorans]|uniref:D-glycero-beta-D-manno-heptose 1-phosphate adenylyltransferase n=1 Tax=Desulfatibacillum aliphaticivorans TaxID=218208 RepID=B8FEV9_DESAL|nr:D-glycero-beta-D-manno-heptose 1-phosphate adenylyltransferase [Desulfatibacillum aliphaticivorans]ACL03636.1 rfaE bifunctional protein [Desulfatibacillum aliphaticivorans]
MISKILSKNELIKAVEKAKAENKTVVFTNGCFDILHVGHVRYLAEAKRQGDVLVLGLNSDRSVREIKGPTRPIVPEAERAEVLAALESIDFISLFDEPAPLDLILAVIPQVLVKGADWPEDQIIGAREVKEAGGKVVRVDLAEGASTTNIIQKILDQG